MKEKGDKYIKDYQRDIVSVYQVRQSKAGERDPNYIRKYSKVFFNLLFWLVCLSKSGLNVIFTVFRFFMPKYICEALNGNDSNKAIRTHVYVVLIVFCPYIGSTMGWMFTKAVGGYGKKKAFLMVFILQVLMAAVSVPLTLWNDWKYYMANGFVYHILSSAIIPCYKGITPFTVEKDYGAAATMISNYFTSGVFNSPAPAIYGLMLDHWKEVDKKWSMRCFTSLPVFGVIFMAIACGIRYSQSEERPSLLEADKNKKPEVKPIKESKDFDEHLAKANEEMKEMNK